MTTKVPVQVLKTAQKKAKREALENLLLHQIRCLKLPKPQRNYKFHPTRKLELDFAWPDLMLAVEVQGGTYSGGKHARGVGYTNDCRKMGEAMALGWVIYWCDTVLVRNGEAIQVIEKLFLFNSGSIDV